MNPFENMNPLLANSLQTSLAVAVLFALVLVVRRPFARQFGAKAAYALWLVPLARLFMPPLPANWSLFGALGPVEAAPEPVMAPPVVFHPAQPSDVKVVVSDLPTAPPVIEFAQAPVADVPAEPGMLDAVMSVAPHLVVPLWLTGIALMLGLAWRRQAVFHRLIRDDSALASDTVSEMAHEIAAQLKVRRGFEVRTSLLNGSPLVTGLKRPVILLPEWFEADYSPREQRDALTHELMHVKRGDLFALQAAQIVLALQWFNPLAYLSIRAFRVDQEAACDADVLRAGTSSAFSYGRTLIKAARLAGPADSAFRGANLTLAHPIKERLILMQNTAPTLRKRLLGTTLAITLGSAAIFTTASCAASATPRDQSSAELAGGDDKVADVERETRAYSFSSHHDDDDRQFVMLSDPFESLQPRLRNLDNLDLSDLEQEMQKLSIEISQVGEMEAIKAISEIDFSELAELSELSGLAELGNMKFDFDLDLDLEGLEDFDIETVETEDGVKIIIPNHEIFISKLDEGKFEIEMEKLEAMAEAHAERAEAMAEVYAERAEAMAEMHEQRADAWEEANDQRMEKMELVIEREIESRADRIEELGDLMEMRIEAAFEDGLEDDLEAAGDVVEELADQCEDRDDDLNSPAIVSARGDDGKTYRALCVNGGSDRLKGQDVKDFVQNHPELSDAEKERFNQQRSYSYEYSWSEE
ncbi:M56 family metallopeptidase [Henriciella sp. AS95]|uniref:M56 family metallopeptidase n=1 Tax=Henriciella sp. AS95 TaxID=3135782 RepID=UPI00316CB71D